MQRTSFSQTEPGPLLLGAQTEGWQTVGFTPCEWNLPLKPCPTSVLLHLTTWSYPWGLLQIVRKIEMPAGSPTTCSTISCPNASGVLTFC